MIKIIIILIIIIIITIITLKTLLAVIQLDCLGKQISSNHKLKTNTNQKHRSGK